MAVLVSPKADFRSDGGQLEESLFRSMKKKASKRVLQPSQRLHLTIFWSPHLLILDSKRLEVCCWVYLATRANDVCKILLQESVVKGKIPSVRCHISLPGLMICI